MIIPKTSIKLNKANLSLTNGASETLTATINPSNATNKTISWTSSNTKVATVNNGVVKAISTGTAIITAKSNNGKTTTCKITVSNTEDVIYDVVLFWGQSNMVGSNRAKNSNYDVYDSRIKKTGTCETDELNNFYKNNKP